MNIKEFFKTQDGKYISIFLTGLLIGYVAFPEKRIEEKITKQYEQKITEIKQINEKQLAKTEEEKSATEKALRSYKRQTEFKLQKLTKEVNELRSKQKTSYYKIVKPDGTIEIKKFTETDVSESSEVISSIKQEYSKKVSELEDKWKKVQEKKVADITQEFSIKEDKYKKEIFRLEQQKITEVGKKRFGVEVGLNSDEELYLHASYDFLGPLFLGGLVTNPMQMGSVGLGLGIRF
jgi:uncharacterized protein YukE